MPRPNDIVDEHTSNLRRDRQKKTSVPDNAPPPEAEAPAGAPTTRRVPCADPDPTEDVARRSAETGPAVDAAPQPSVTEASIPVPPGRPDGTAEPGVLVAPEDDDSQSSPAIVEPNLHGIRQFVAGDVIANRFVIVDSLAGSGMGQVYKALDRQRDAMDAPSSYVAIKFAQMPLADSDTSTQLVRREYGILTRLSHPNIVKAFEIGTHNGADFMVMEWLEGQSLLHVLEQQTCKRMALQRAQGIIRDVAAGLACAHEHGIVHGDIKPSNIFITRRGAAKLLDFGAISENSDDAERQSWATRAYASVDVLDGRPATRSDDVYSLGVTAYLLLSGERPFATKDAAEAKRENFQVQALPNDAADMWPAIQAALSFDAAKRPPDAARFLADFLRLKPGTAAIEPTRRPYLRISAIAVLVIALATSWYFRLDNMSGIDPRATLDKARIALAEGRLTEPDSENALHYFNAVLATSPDNPEAKQGLDRIADEILVRAADALAINRLGTARSNLATAKRVAPDHESIPIVERLFERYTTDLLVSARLAAERDPEEAEAILQRVEQLTDNEADSVAEILEQIDKNAVDREIRALIAGIDERILAERLAVPRGDSAIDLLNRARELRPDDDRLPIAANRIVSALLFQALFAISEGKLARAEEFLADARSLDVRHLATARAEYELAKARDRIAAEAYESALQKNSEAGKPDESSVNAENTGDD